MRVFEDRADLGRVELVYRNPNSQISAVSSTRERKNAVALSAVVADDRRKRSSIKPNLIPLSNFTNRLVDLATRILPGISAPCSLGGGTSAAAAAPTPRRW